MLCDILNVNNQVIYTADVNAPGIDDTSVLNRIAVMDALTSGTTLAGAHIFNAQLHNVTFDGLDLTGIRLCNSTMNDCSFRGTNLTGATIDFTVLSGSDFTGATLTGVNFINVDASNSDFTDADLTNITSSNTIFSGSKFVNTKLSGANLSTTLLAYIDFTGCDMSGGIKTFENHSFTRPPLLYPTEWRELQVWDGVLTFDCQHWTFDYLQNTITDAEIRLVGGTAGIAWWNANKSAVLQFATDNGRINPT